MSDKMLKFVKIGQQNPPKTRSMKEIKILMKFIKSSLMKKLRHNQVDVLNVEYLFVKFIAH